MQQNYEVINRLDKRILSLKGEIIETTICDFNSARIYRLKDNRYLLMPSSVGNYAILYNEKKIIEGHIKNKHFPIGVETDSPYEPEKENISDINNNIKSYVDYVRCKYNLEEAISYNISVKKHLDILTKNINLKKLTKYDIMAIGLYVDEIFRQKTKTNWHLEKVLTINTYWVPSLISSTGERFSVSSVIFKFINENHVLDLSLCYKIEKEKYDGTSPIGN